MTLVSRGGEAFPLEDVAEVAAAVAADNLGAEHAEGAVLVAGDGSGDGVKVGGPAAARGELVRGLIEGGVAAGAGVDSGCGVVLVELAGAGRFGALFAEDAELFLV